MERIGVRELRQNASRYLARVKQGESIEVTERGVPVAVLSPVPAEKTSLYDRLVAEGKLIPGKGDFIQWMEENPLPTDPDLDGPTATEILLQMREDERY
ncbi:MAG: type II toxin-antitoxin system Phd/YefM family antitoxin [Microbacteriaceae bacterium]